MTKIHEGTALLDASHWQPEFPEAVFVGAAIGRFAHLPSGRPAEAPHLVNAARQEINATSGYLMGYVQRFPGAFEVRDFGSSRISISDEEDGLLSIYMHQRLHGKTSVGYFFGPGIDACSAVAKFDTEPVLYLPEDIGYKAFVHVLRVAKKSLDLGRGVVSRTVLPHRH